MATPAWIQALADDDTLRAIGFALVDDDDAESRSDGLRDYYAGSYHLGTLWLGSVWAECQERVARCRVVARGPARVDGLGIDRVPLFILQGPDDDALWLAWNDDIPASLWIPCGRTPASIAEALAEFIPAERPLLHAFECRTRLFMGYYGKVRVPNPYSGEMVAADSHELSRHFNFSPVVSGHYWSSSERDDPWPEPGAGTQSAVAGIALQRRVARQAVGGVASYTRRTLYSGSYLGLELHRRRLWVWDLRHPRSRHPGVIEAFNARHDADFPTDLPIDVVAAMIGFGHASEEAMREGLEEAGDNAPAYLEVLAALLCGDGAAASSLLRRFAAHPSLQVRGLVLELAARYGWLSILEEMRIDDPAPEILAYIDSILPWGRPERFDESGDPVVEGEDDDDDDDEEDDA